MKRKLLSDKPTFENLVSLRTPADKILILLIDESKKKIDISVKTSSCRVSMTLHFSTYSFYRTSNGDESNELREILT
jgi:hypothetical protein